MACRNVFCAAKLNGDGNIQRGVDGLAQGLRGVIADFGRTVLLPVEGETGKVTEPKQPLRNQPPEVLKGMVFTRRSDSFSFAMMAWAALNGSKPWPQLSARDAAVAHIEGRRLEAPIGPFADGQLYEGVVVECWRQQEWQRLEMPQVVESLETRFAELMAEGAGAAGDNNNEKVDSTAAETPQINAVETGNEEEGADSDDAAEEQYAEMDWNQVGGEAIGAATAGLEMAANEGETKEGEVKTAPAAAVEIASSDNAGDDRDRKGKEPQQQEVTKTAVGIRIDEEAKEGQYAEMDWGKAGRRTSATM